MRKFLLIMVSILFLVLIGMVGFLFLAPESPAVSTDVTTEATTLPTEAPTTLPPETTEPPTTIPEETEPAIQKTSVTLSAIGDILLHDAVLATCYDASTKTYDFSSIFHYISGHFQAADWAVVNFETTLGGSYYNISGFPLFNSPDSILEALENAGVNLLLTSNNHAYDTFSIGIRRTVEKIEETSLQYLGTTKAPEDPNFMVVEQDGIRLGLACYTYESGSKGSSKGINGITMKQEDAGLINSFNPFHPESFYEETAETIALMKAADVDGIIYFMHWGTEYSMKVNEQQYEIAQKLCDLGVDVIIGGHAHVVQPADLLTSTVDENHKTICLYSMGNAVSNQRGGYTKKVPTDHTEDGVMFRVTFSRYEDGTVLLETAESLPIWVNMGKNPNSGKKEYNILPLDKTMEDWKTAFDLTDKTLADALASYDRTMELVGEGMAEIDAYLSQRVETFEKNLTK